MRVEISLLFIFTEMVFWEKTNLFKDKWIDGWMDALINRYIDDGATDASILQHNKYN